MRSDDDAIRELVAQLNDDRSAEWASDGLRQYGSAILPHLIEAAPGLPHLGQLCAIELFVELGDGRAGAALIRMLRSEHDTVHEWAAEAVAELRIYEAVPELRRVYDEVKGREPPDWTGPVRLRDALTVLGAREAIVPPRVAELSRIDRGSNAAGQSRTCPK
jgi:HEAT repeat protein